MGAGAGRGGQAGLFGTARHGAACAQPAAPTPAQGCFCWQWSGLREGGRGAGHGAPSGVRALCCVWEEGKDIVAVRREHAALDVPQSSLPCPHPNPWLAKGSCCNWGGLSPAAAQLPRNGHHGQRVQSKQCFFPSLDTVPAAKMAQTNPLPVPMGPWKVRPRTPCILPFLVCRCGAGRVAKPVIGGTAGSEAGGAQKSGPPCSLPTGTCLPPAQTPPGCFISLFAGPWPSRALFLPVVLCQAAPASLRATRWCSPSPVRAGRAGRHGDCKRGGGHSRARWGAAPRDLAIALWTQFEEGAERERRSTCASGAHPNETHGGRGERQPQPPREFPLALSPVNPLCPRTFGAEAGRTTSHSPATRPSQKGSAPLSGWHRCPGN
ncbi:hypothetical protein Q9966_011193 [Columba livia]|nr:hypothetical protein Q9966_011193 [Columba livia]KAK2525446.1 hypothetical protein Q9966_011193 [Columba livia]